MIFKYIKSKVLHNLDWREYITSPYKLHSTEPEMYSPCE